MKRFKFAFNGIINVFKNEQNFRIHAVSAVFVIIAGFIFSVNKTEWTILIIAISMTASFEMINSALEYLSNFVSPGYDNKIKIIKDAAAGAVLISALGAFILACIIFLPKIISV